MELKPLNEKLLNRIKDEECNKRHSCNWNNLPRDFQYMLYPEVCRRYAEEVSKEQLEANELHIDELKAIEFDLQNEISQLKKQLEEKNKELKAADSLLNERQRVLDAIPECPDHGKCVPHALEWIKSKLEVKEKPDFEFISMEEYSSDIGRIAFSEGCEKIWNDYVIPRDAAIAERDEKIGMLYVSRIESIKASLEKGYRTGDFSDNSIVIVE